MTATRHRAQRTRSVGAMGALVSLTAVGAAAGSRRHVRSGAVRDLLGRGGGPQSVAYGVDGRRVVGVARGQAFMHDGTRVHWLEGLGGGRARSVRGDVVVGSSFGLVSPRRPWRWRGTVGAPMPLPADAVTGEAVAVAGSGAVAGNVQTADQRRTRAVWWDSDDRPTVLHPPGGDRSEATALLPDGRIVGSGTDDRGTVHACVWDDDGGLRVLRGLTNADAYALAADDRGRLVGCADLADGTTRACVWDTAGQPHALPGAGGGRGRANGVQPGGVIVGATLTEQAEREACLWTADGALCLLGTLGGTTSEAFAVSRTGTVVGVASTGAGATGLRLRPGAWSWEEHAFTMQVSSAVEPT